MGHDGGLSGFSGLKVSRGFQSGTTQGRATTAFVYSKVIEPENLMAYEGGVKSQWLDNRLRINADGFLSEYTNQVIPIVGQNLSIIEENAGSSEFWGFELEAVALPLRGVEATLNYSYLNTRYLKCMENGVNVANQRDVAEAPDNTIMAGLGPHVHGTAHQRRSVLGARRWVLGG